MAQAPGRSREARPRPDEGWRAYRRKPATVQARRLTAQVEVATREGTMTGRPGDWLVRSPEGGEYPCSDDVFRKTHEEATPLGDGYIRVDLPGLD